MFSLIFKKLNFAFHFTFIGCLSFLNFFLDLFFLCQKFIFLLIMKIPLGARQLYFVSTYLIYLPNLIFRVHFASIFACQRSRSFNIGSNRRLLSFWVHLSLSSITDLKSNIRPLSGQSMVTYRIISSKHWLWSSSLIGHIPDSLQNYK